jgi:hypothetical protein
MAASDSNDFSTKTKEILSKKAGQTCSKCKRHTSGGNSNPQKATIIGQAAHIEGSRLSDRRYNPKMTPEERSNIENGIWLCASCHKEIDDDPKKFTLELLHKMKAEHEDCILNSSPNKQDARSGFNNFGIAKVSNSVFIDTPVNNFGIFKGDKNTHLND